MKSPKSNHFSGYFTISPSDRVTRQLVITATPDVANELDEWFISKGIIPMKSLVNETIIMRIDISKE